MQCEELLGFSLMSTVDQIDHELELGEASYVHPARTKVRSPARPRARRPGPAPAGFRWARARRSLRPRAARDIDRARLLPRQAREDRPAAPWYTRVHYIECGYSKCCSRV